MKNDVVFVIIYELMCIILSYAYLRLVRLNFCIVQKGIIIHLINMYDVNQEQINQSLRFDR